MKQHVGIVLEVMCRQEGISVSTSSLFHLNIVVITLKCHKATLAIMFTSNCNKIVR